MQHQRTTRGFSLLEILLAVVIFALGSLGICGLLIAILQSHQEAITEQRLVLLAESLVAELQGTEVRQGVVLETIYRQRSQNFPEYEYDLLFEQTDFQTIFVTLQVRYQQRGQSQQISFHTVLLRSW